MSAAPNGMKRQEASMNTTAIKAVMRHAADAMSRRGSFRVLGAAALAGALAAPQVASAGKAGKKVQKRCRKQRDQCVSAVVAFCASFVDPPECEEIYGSCCEHFARCNPRAGFGCLLVGD